MLPAMAADVRRMADAVAALPHVDEEITRVAAATPALDADRRPAARHRWRRWTLLTEIHATLGPLPPALEKLDVALDQLVADLVPLQAAAERLNQLRLPGSRRRRGTDQPADEQENGPLPPVQSEAGGRLPSLTAWDRGDCNTNFGRAATCSRRALVDERVGVGVLLAGHGTDAPLPKPAKRGRGASRCSGIMAGCLTL